MQMQSSVILTKNYLDLLAATFFEEYSRLLKVYVNASTLEDPPYDMILYFYTLFETFALLRGGGLLCDYCLLLLPQKTRVT